MRKIKYPFYKGHFDITIKDNKFYKIEIKKTLKNLDYKCPDLICHSCL